MERQQRRRKRQPGRRIKKPSPAREEVAQPLGTGSEPPEERSQVEGLEDARGLLENMVRAGWGLAEVAKQVVDTLAFLLAEWQWTGVKFVEHGGARLPVGIEREKLSAAILARWEERGGSQYVAPQPLTPFDEIRIKNLLRDALLEFGMGHPEISSRFNNLPRSAATDEKRLLASGYYEFFVQLCVHGSDQLVTDEKLFQTYERFHEAHYKARLATGPVLTDIAFFVEIGKTFERVPDEKSPAGQSFKPLRHPKLAQKGEPRKWARRGLGLRNDAEIETAIKDPQSVAQQLFAAMEGGLRNSAELNVPAPAKANRARD